MWQKLLNLSLSPFFLLLSVRFRRFERVITSVGFDTGRAVKPRYPTVDDSRCDCGEALDLKVDPFVAKMDIVTGEICDL